jgi:hypothetical protein
LDTIKYTDQDFEQLALPAIDQAVVLTQQDWSQPPDTDQIIRPFLLAKRALVSSIDNQGEKTLLDLGSPLGFSLLNDFSGMHYMYFGDFSALRPEVVIWRLEMLREIIEGRRLSIDDRVAADVIPEDQRSYLDDLLSRLEIWVILSSEDDKNAVATVLAESQGPYVVRVYSREDVWSELRELGQRYGFGKRGDKQ